MTYILVGFIFGFFTPYLARRFAKFMPATPAYALYRIFKRNKQISKDKRIKNIKYLKLKNRYIMRSIGCGIIVSACTFFMYLAKPHEASWLSFLIIILFILMEIDKRTMLLPDILTVPLLIMGFSYASFAGSFLAINPVYAVQNASLGAILGFLIPTLAALFMVKKHPDAFGGGDVKLLSAIGAWLGVVNIPFIILISCIIFGISCFIKKQRAAAFGPSIAISTLIMMFILSY